MKVKSVVRQQAGSTRKGVEAFQNFSKAVSSGFNTIPHLALALLV